MTTSIGVISDLGLGASTQTDFEFVRISEMILEYGKADLTLSESIESLVDQRQKLKAVGEYIVRVIRSNELKIQAQNNIAEIRIRQERKIGQLLHEMQKNTGGRPTKTPDATSEVLRLADIGVSHKQSSRWQDMAALPNDRFENHIAEAKENGWELTSVGVQRHGRAYKENQDENDRPLTRTITLYPQDMPKSIRAFCLAMSVTEMTLRDYLLDR